MKPTKLHTRLSITASGQKAVDWLHADTGLSKQALKAAMAKGAVWLITGRQHRRLRRATALLQAGQVLELFYDASLLDIAVPTPTLVADQGQYSVWHKPPMLLAQGTQWGDHCSLLRWVEQHLRPQRPCWLVHRLDREAEGLMVIAHHRAAAAQLSALFQGQSVEKLYAITVHGLWPETMPERRVDLPLDGKPAVSHFSVLAVDPVQQQSRLRVRLETGRLHQIRRHAAALGFPVVGDARYGQADANGLQLHAMALRFVCPVTGQPRAWGADPRDAKSSQHTTTD